MVLKIGHSQVSLDNGVIVSIKRGNTTVSSEDDIFEGALTYLLLNAVNHHPNKFLFLLENINPVNDYTTKKALFVIKQFNLPNDISKAIDHVMKKK